MPEPPQHLFVYGTLRRGQHEMARLLSDGAVAIGKGSVQGRLYLVENYPGATWSQHPHDRVRGEVYRLRDERVLSRLDDYEDFRPDDPLASLFLRRLADVRMEDGTRLMAWIYYYNRPTQDLPAIPSGDFLDVRHQAKRALPA